MHCIFLARELIVPRRVLRTPYQSYSGLYKTVADSIDDAIGQARLTFMYEERINKAGRGLYQALLQCERSVEPTTNLTVLRIPLCLSRHVFAVGATTEPAGPENQY